jgi:hypothetical protein
MNDVSSISYKYMRVPELKLCGAASKYSQLHMITWLYASYTSRQPWAVQQNGGIIASRNSVTWLNVIVPRAASVKTEHWWWHPKILISPSAHSVTVEPSNTFTLPSRESILACSQGMSSCCTTPFPMWPEYSRTCWTPCAGPSPYIPDLSPCDVHVFSPLKRALQGCWFGLDETLRLPLFSSSPKSSLSNGSISWCQWAACLSAHGNYIKWPLILYAQ